VRCNILIPCEHSAAITARNQEDSALRSNPMKKMKYCLGTCARVPDEVSTALADSLQVIPEGSSSPDACDARAVVIALRMAMEGWRFCPCFSEGTTPQHARIFGLVQTNLANSLAHNAQVERTLPVEKLSAA